MILPSKQPLSFSQYKTRMQHLEREQVELIRALEQTTRNLEEAALDFEIMYKELLKFMPETEIEILLESEDASQSG